jgi:hypothetical protein
MRRADFTATSSSYIGTTLYATVPITSKNIAALPNDI